jgi:hypothetical protein
MNAELSEINATGFAGAFNEFPFQQLGDLIFRDAGHGGDDLEVAKAGIDFDSVHHEKVSFIGGRNAMG